MLEDWHDFYLLVGGAAGALTGAAVAVARIGVPGFYAIAAAQGALMILGIRNAWDLITWIAPRAQGDQPPPGEA